MIIFNTLPNRKNLSQYVFLIAFIIRALVFGLYVQHHERYRQADSNDYHICAFLLSYNQTMTKPDGEPIFWRTPGYPLYLASFYYMVDYKNAEFHSYAWAQKASIWLQIFLCSFIPIIIFFLTLLITGILPLAWICTYIAVFHLGFILAATHLLTDALASLLFFIFLWMFYRSWNMIGEANKVRHWIASLSCAALALAAYTWMRPMGIFVACVATVLLVLANDAWNIKFNKIALFLLLFFGSTAPWYIRNYSLTGSAFFCPMSGGIAQAFCAPKIIRRVTGQPLEACMRKLYLEICMQTEQQQALYKAQGSSLYVCKHLICSKVAMPIMMQYPLYAMSDWIVQVCKTLFDLYSSQLVAFATNTYTYDPLEEFLTDKLAACLYAIPLPYAMRIISWLELFFCLLLWLGIIAGLCRFVIKELYYFFKRNKAFTATFYLWIKTGIMIGALACMTGGFGYARLRIPFEPLLILLSLTWWWSILKKKI